MTTNTPQSVLLADMTWPEAKVAIQAAKVAIIPVGSTEQHGPGMTLSTDIALAAAVAERVAEAVSPRVIVAPPLPYGMSSHHMNFPGTITLSAATFGSVLKDVISSLQTHGIDRFLLLNGHGGNQSALAVIASEVGRELNVNIATALYLAGAYDFLQKEFGRTHAHACEIEVSVALATVPRLVRSESLKKGEELPSPWRHTAFSQEEMPVGPFVTRVAPFEQLTRNGSIGDARKGTAEKGEAIVSHAVKRLGEFITDFAGE